MSDWYYAANNEQKGPVNESELKANLAANKIPADTLVWKDGMDNWTPANQVPAFTFRQPPIPAKVQPPAMSASPAPSAAPETKAAPAASPVNNPSSTEPVDVSTLMGTPQSLEVDEADAEKNKIFGILAYVPIPLPLLWIVPLSVAKDSPYAKYHANQGLALFICWLAVIIVVMVTDGIFGVLGLSFLNWIFGLLYIGPVVLVIFGIINAAAGKCVPLPVIGGIKLIK